MIKKVFYWETIVVVFFCLAPFLFFYFIFFWGYYTERDEILDELNQIPGVRVLKIWGNEDITFENINALIEIKNKGKIILSNLSSDVINYPLHVDIMYIGDYSFKTFFPNRQLLSGYLDIGEFESSGIKIGIKFFKPSDVINNYDTIFSYVKSLPTLPKNVLPILNDKKFDVNEKKIVFKYTKKLL